jgi:hypothetical protein
MFKKTQQGKAILIVATAASVVLIVFLAAWRLVNQLDTGSLSP